MPPSRRKRCPNGTRFNKTSKTCDPFNKKGLPCEYTGNRKRCQRSTRCNIRTGKCDTTTHALRMKRCRTGYRRNRVTKECDKYNKQVQRVSDEEEEEEDEMFQDEEKAPPSRMSPTADWTNSERDMLRLLGESPVPEHEQDHPPRAESPSVKALARALGELSLNSRSSSKKSPRRRSSSKKSPSVKALARSHTPS